MNKYPAWWDSTITVYNKVIDPITRITSWSSVIIPNCFWKRVNRQTNSGNIISDTNSIVCRIPENDLFVPPVKWLGLQDKQGTFTLKPGDIIVHGDCTDVIDEYTSGMRSTDLLTRYRMSDSCMEIKEVSIDTMTSMLYPHYRVSGS